MVFLDRNRFLDIDQDYTRRSQPYRQSRSLIRYSPGESLGSFCRRTGWHPEEVVRLNSNESPFSLLPSVQAVLAESRDNYYPDATKLVEHLAAYTGVPGDQIVLGHGSTDLLDRLWLLFGASGSRVIGCPPTYSYYDTLTCRYDAIPHLILRRPDFTLNVDLLLEELTPTSLIVVCSPNNPTGTPAREGEVRRLLETGQMVLLDEAYIEFSACPQGMVHLLAEYPNLVISCTISKAFGLAALRVGYTLGSSQVAELLRTVQAPFTPNAAGVRAACESLRQLDDIRTRVQALVRERERLFALLAATRILVPYPSQGNFLLARLEHLPIEHLRTVVEQAGIQLRYLPKLDGMHDFVRVTVGLSHHTERLLTALATVSSEALEIDARHVSQAAEILPESLGGK
jgi:histidinol-phosphate aminotransferase